MLPGKLIMEMAKKNSKRKNKKTTRNHKNDKDDDSSTFHRIMTQTPQS